MRAHLPLVLLLTLAGTVRPLDAQRALSGTAVIITGEHATVPIPTLMEGPANTTGNQDVADLLFLRLAVAQQGRSTADEASYLPQLARRWQRIDSLTIRFELDPRARWHDGRPVTSADVVFTFDRARNSAIAPSLADHLGYLERVAADGPRAVVMRFSRAYPEQFFDATRYVQPLPRHVLGSLTPEQIRTSRFVQVPIGNGPYRWGRASGGEFLELVGLPNFFLGRPGIGRVIFRTATDADARMNLLLTGEADALQRVIPPLSNRDRIEARGEMRLVTIPSSSVGYLLFNQRAAGDSLRRHPILADLRVRRALVLALDRDAMLRSVMGPYAKVPFGPVSTVLWISAHLPAAPRADTAEARRLLAEAGWIDHNGDGTLDRNGEPLRVTVDVPSTSGLRRRMAELAQEQYRKVGIDLVVSVIERGVWMERHTGGRFDIGFGSASQDPSPTSLSQSWGCGGSSNVSHYCDAGVDSLMLAAQLQPAQSGELWAAAMQRLEAGAPAAFLYAPYDVVAIHRRFEDVELRSDSPWLMIWKWRVRPGAALPRDRLIR